MKPTTEYTSSIIELVNSARPFNENIGNYVEHYINENFQYSVRLDNNHALEIRKSLVQDFFANSSFLDLSDFFNIADSVWKLE